nr:MAG TPA: hypothetical protein [Caudoviricetes sp.]
MDSIPRLFLLISTLILPNKNPKIANKSAFSIKTEIIPYSPKKLSKSKPLPYY